MVPAGEGGRKAEKSKKSRTAGSKKSCIILKAQQKGKPLAKKLKGNLKY